MICKNIPNMRFENLRENSFNGLRDLALFKNWIIVSNESAPNENLLIGLQKGLVRTWSCILPLIWQFYCTHISSKQIRSDQRFLSIITHQIFLFNILGSFAYKSYQALSHRLWDPPTGTKAKASQHPDPSCVRLDLIAPPLAILLLKLDFNQITPHCILLFHSPTPGQEEKDAGHKQWCHDEPVSVDYFPLQLWCLRQEASRWYRWWWVLVGECFQSEVCVAVPQFAQRSGALHTAAGKDADGTGAHRVRTAVFLLKQPRQLSCSAIVI